MNLLFVQKTIRVFPLFSFLILAACGHSGGVAAVPASPVILTVGSPVSDTVASSGFNAYTATVTPGALYKISMTGVADDTDLLVYGTDSTFSTTVRCAIDNTSIIGVSPEDCIMSAPGNTLYFGIDGTFITAGSAAYTIDIELLSTTNLSISVPFAGETTQTTAGLYSVPVSTGAIYTVGITALSDDADLYVFGSDGTFSATAACNIGGPIGNTLYTGTTPEDCTLPSSDGTFYFIVDGIFSSAPTVLFTALATPAPAIPNPANEGSIGSPDVLSLDAPRYGQVGNSGTSFYSVSGLTSGTRYTVSILGLTADADLAVYGADSTFTNKTACQIDNTSFVGTTPESCTLTVSGSTIYFSVASKTTSGGVAYINLIEQGP